MNFNAKQFMQIYVWLFRFKCIDTQNIDDIYGIICSFNNSFNSFVDASPLFDDKIIKVLDKYESIPFDIKANIMLQFYEFSRNVHFGLKSMFNEEVSSKLDSNISNMLLIRLGDYLNDALNKGINLDYDKEPFVEEESKANDIFIDKLVESCGNLLESPHMQELEGTKLVKTKTSQNGKSNN